MGIPAGAVAGTVALDGVERPAAPTLRVRTLRPAPGDVDGVGWVRVPARLLVKAQPPRLLLQLGTRPALRPRRVRYDGADLGDAVVAQAAVEVPVRAEPPRHSQLFEKDSPFWGGPP